MTHSCRTFPYRINARARMYDLYKKVRHGCVMRHGFGSQSTRG
jgi:hypothetical protein